MTYGSKLKPLFYLCLILTFVLAGCSNDDQSTGENAVEEKESVAKQTTAKDKNADSLYAKSIRKNRKPVRKDFKRDYTKALEALKKENYDTAQSLLTGAIAINNNEQLVIPFFGMRVGSYLPHYHLGMIAFLNGDCVTAMDHWKTSLGQNVIQKVPEYQYLQETMPECGSEDR